ncbi:MAG: inositol monophosphatase [Myxococcaceae bacterium]|nr:inositol monophosphatase [Myxococcaceae bacterium]MCI0670435.1 inositol monophosphatase [Myxococcaceae bacterium]
MSEESVSGLRAAAEEAARRAGRVLAERFGGERTIGFKGDIDLVTDADRASEAVLLGFLRERYPSHAVLAEESGEAQGVGFRWVVDPLDGTVNYAHRLPHFAVSVAVEGPGGLLAGVVFDPMRDELFSAGRGEGATLNGRPIRVSAEGALERALLCTGFPYDVHARPETPLALLAHFLTRAQGIRRLGSAALDLAYVAAGRYEGFFEVRLKPWDVAAGALLVMEAGGTVAQLGGGAFSLASGDVLACNAALAPRMKSECVAVMARLAKVPG